MGVKDFKVKSHKNPTHCEHCMEGKWGWASRKKGEDLKLEEDNEQDRDISRYKCRKTLSLLSIVT